MYQAEQMRNRISSEKNFINILCHLVKQLSMPDIELDVFDGNLLDFYYFITFLDELVESKFSEPRGRLDRLPKYISGNAKRWLNRVHWNRQL